MWLEAICVSGRVEVGVIMGVKLILLTPGELIERVTLNNYIVHNLFVGMNCFFTFIHLKILINKFYIQHYKNAVTDTSIFYKRSSHI